MIKTHLPIYLASRSPRRSKLLKQINIEFKVFNVDVDEAEKPGENPVEMVTRLAAEKSEAARKIIDDGIIITADTTVFLNDKILGKPADEEDAVRMLKYLSGKTHQVYTGFSIYNCITDSIITDYEKTSVTFIDLSDEDIKDYAASGSPLDKAGAYGIQDDFGAVFIKEIEGCYYNVVGLPLSKLYSTLKRIV